MADIKKIQLPDGTSLEIKDEVARIAVATKQDTLVSGTNIKTINSESLLGSGNINISGAAVATDSTLGTIKTNAAESITLNADNQLKVGGRLGQMTSTNGLYHPMTISPENVGNGSMLITEATGTFLGNKSMSVSTGNNITLKTSAAAGATQYQVPNTYENRIICACLAGGVLATNEGSAPTKTVKVTSVRINGSNYTPDSSADNSSMNIVITVAESLNPSGTLSSVRAYPKQDGFSNMFVGQQIANTTNSAGANILVGQKIGVASGNANAIVGANIYNTGNGNAIFGRNHISRKNRGLLAGTGHDTTNAKSESVVALGEYSNITDSTAFAIGNGTSATNRRNMFSIDTSGNIVTTGELTVGSAPTQSMHAATKKYVDDAITTAINATY